MILIWCYIKDDVLSSSLSGTSIEQLRTEGIAVHSYGLATFMQCSIHAVNSKIEDLEGIIIDEDITIKAVRCPDQDCSKQEGNDSMVTCLHVLRMVDIMLSPFICSGYLPCIINQYPIPWLSFAYTGIKVLYRNDSTVWYLSRMWYYF